MAIKKSQLYSALWESCNALRGSMDASQYKDYVLMMLFVKYLSDKAGTPGYRLRMPDGCSKADFISLKQNDKIGELINIKLEAIRNANARYIGDLQLPNFNDPNKFGTTMRDTLSRLISIFFEDDNLDFSHNRAADDDLLGDAYEYLMKNFAAESGKSKGQFYTPAEVSRVIAKVLHLSDLDRAEQTIYDPACGSGSLLLRALAEASNQGVSIRGQEKDSTTAGLAKLNMLLHGINKADIKTGDTLGDPQFKAGTLLETFDVCVANPPFSLKNWLATGMENDPYNRWSAAMLPPEKCGDYAFLLHLIASMKSETGRGACILPLGVLFRGNAEYELRKDIVNKHYIKGIIGLPPNIFFGTGIPASIIIIDKKNKDAREGIFFIDAKDGFKKDGAKNRLREQDIKRIVDAWEAHVDVPHFCRMVKWDEITDKKNDYNLNIPRYITPVDTEIQHDIEAHLHGGLPRYDVDGMQTYWNACPTLKGQIFKQVSADYYDLNINKEDITATVDSNADYTQQKSDFAVMLNAWKAEIEPKMKGIKLNDRPKDMISAWADSLLSAAKAHNGLVNAYDIYDVMMNYWVDTMQDDCYMVSNDGWTYPEVKAVKNKVSKNKKIGKETTKEVTLTYDQIVCDLLPVSIVVDEFFNQEKQVIDQLNADIDQLNTDIAEMLEEKSDIFDGYDTLKEIKDAYAAANYKKPLYGEKDILEAFLALLADKAPKAEQKAFAEEHAEVFCGMKLTQGAVKSRLKEIAAYKPLSTDELKVGSINSPLN